ncbi:DegV family protein [Neofamilia massiliensis]|uniref:DegV family protein n=1 Tax=Neofamilia massiliensis TaxID=1673724 RepID=UPI0006BB8056|nr:DegV family protein [Neofamilia massiliensis]
MRKYAIVADTSCEITEEMEKDFKIDFVPFKIDIDNQNFVDDENLDVDNFIDTMLESPNPVKTACPSPGDYQEALEKNADAEEIFVITISSKLSGSYHSACIARDMFLEDHKDKKVHVIDSKSAVSGETLVYTKLVDILKENLVFDEIVKKITDLVDNTQTLFVLDDLSNLIKNGRMNKPAGMLANFLHIKPVMKSVDGEIELHEIARGMNSSLNKLVKSIGDFVEDTKNKTLVISAVRAPESVEKILDGVKKLYDFARIEVTQTRGLSSAYASDKGIVIAFEK